MSRAVNEPHRISCDIWIDASECLENELEHARRGEHRAHVNLQAACSTQHERLSISTR